MVDNCKHIDKLRPPVDSSAFNPQKWSCLNCGTTESVWACLSCPMVACGSYIQDHRSVHYMDSHHPLTIEVNEKCVYCFECKDYILNDNAAGDIKILRSALSVIKPQAQTNTAKQCRRSSRIRTIHTAPSQESEICEESHLHTAIWFRRYYVLAKAFTSWKQSTPLLKKKMDQQKAKEKRQQQLKDKNSVQNQFVPSKTIGKKFVGVTGLRNLGNTCYMNSVLQVLGHLLSYQHLADFRECFLSFTDSGPRSPSDHLTKNHQRNRRSFPDCTTSKCGEFKENDSSHEAGLNGGAQFLSKKQLSKSYDGVSDNLSLCFEFCSLLKALWSGKWALVSPQRMLHSVWNIIPFFRGYRQQDAQEFLCEFLDKMTSEMSVMQKSPRKFHNSTPHPGSLGADVLWGMFSGELHSQVTCKRCKHQSATQEPFTDLSLEFPERYQNRSTRNLPNIEVCHIEEMLKRFTSTEELDGAIYACEKCNGKRRHASPKPTIYTKAEKRLVISQPPRVLRLHLKRFMWHGKNQRGKITSHVTFGDTLDLRPYVHPALTVREDSLQYTLSAVVRHHGRGFGSGHYTAYCWNDHTRCWIHCNDAKMQLVGWDSVTDAQAYILFYTCKNFIPSPLCRPLTTVSKNKSPTSTKTQAAGTQQAPVSNGLQEVLVDNDAVLRYHRKQAQNQEEEPVQALPTRQENGDHVCATNNEITDAITEEDGVCSYQISIIPRFMDMKRKLSLDHEGRMELKRRRTAVW